MNNLHDLRSHGGYMVGVDFRLAGLDHLDLTESPVNLRRAFLTCADLTGSEFGKADLEFADLSGSILSGADLSGVANLSVAQLTGATVDDATQLPAGIDLSAALPWDHDHCVRYTREMAGLRSGAGYDDDILCPTTLEVYAASTDTRSDAASPDAVVDVCTARNG
jgi:hypothetical protein